MTKTFKFLVTVGLALSFAAGSLTAPDAAANASAVVTLSGQVPLRCDVSLDGAPVPLGSGTYVLGRMDSTCNARRGYSITAYGGPDFAGAMMDVSGRVVTFDASGTAILVETMQGGLQSETLILVSENADPSSLSLSISAH